jgi:hypothetical protein
VAKRALSGFEPHRQGASGIPLKYAVEAGPYVGEAAPYVVDVVVCSSGIFVRYDTYVLI